VNAHTHTHTHTLTRSHTHTCTHITHMHNKYIHIHAHKYTHALIKHTYTSHITHLHTYTRTLPQTPPSPLRGLESKYVANIKSKDKVVDVTPSSTQRNVTRGEGKEDDGHEEGKFGRK